MESGGRVPSQVRYLALHDLTFLDKGINPLFIGSPGPQDFPRSCPRVSRLPGHAARRLHHRDPRSTILSAEIHGQLERALRRYCRADFLVLDDFAVLTTDPAQANLAFQVISDGETDEVVARQQIA